MDSIYMYIPDAHVYYFQFNICVIYVFSESLKSVGSRATSATLAHHGALAGGLGRLVDDHFSTMVDTATEKPPARKEVRRDEDMKMLVNILMKERLCEDLGPRCHQGMSKLKDVVVKKIPYLEKI
ncbi:hypothetical protein DPMN_070484 [Dreissena polymorpha]|uniref:Uncharacterized protein n=1 Tax=Dreissena polymorpha TaxID=45954 RepID=A0A9D4BNY7_DREPO|nr:hypothetical protein DPMN_070484 [Dreissena polymorpha]